MATPFHTTVSLKGYHFEDSIFTFNIEGDPTSADVGKAVALSANAANTVRLAADDDVVFGRIQTIENRQEGDVAAVELSFCGTLPRAAATSPAVGNTILGAGAGAVKPVTAATTAGKQPLIVEVETDYVTVVMT